MKPIIIASKQDPAGMNIAENLQEINPQIKIHYVNCKIINPENIDKEQKLQNYDFFIFASEHSSKENKKTLTVHNLGNWRDAKFGGKEGKICKASSLFSKHIFRILKQENTSDFAVSLEVTHHGPYLEKPCIFIEIGSNKTQWTDKKAGKIIANTIIKAIKTKPKKSIPAIGIGGRHYCHNFNKIQLNSKYALGHIIPQYAFPITKEMIQQAIDKTTEKTKTAILDWKGMKGEERQEVIKLCKQLNLKVLRTSDIEK